MTVEREGYGRSIEDYLEAILVLGRSSAEVRSVDVARHLGITKPSVTFAVRALMERGFVEKDGHRALILTEEGRKIAERVDHRHTVLSAMLREMGVSEVTAEKDACEMEHVISEETFQRILNRNEKKD